MVYTPANLFIWGKKYFDITVLNVIVFLKI